MMQAVSESSGGALSAYPQVRWSEGPRGFYQGHIPGRKSVAAVINYGYAVSLRLNTESELVLDDQEFPTVAQACAAAEQWLTQIV